MHTARQLAHLAASASFCDNLGDLFHPKVRQIGKQYRETAPCDWWTRRNQRATQSAASMFAAAAMKEISASVISEDAALRQLLHTTLRPVSAACFDNN